MTPGMYTNVELTEINIETKNDEATRVVEGSLLNINVIR